MKIDNKVFCNVCLASSCDDEHIVFLKATKNNEEVDICTSCVPSVIHGSGMVVKSNDEVKKEI
ncbi:hypothetical protein [Campylobacter canadensis]|uniref:Uncharacterized protein n=1 Tax=Campylobacter canadensis TaxID=449520 RepID=A0ABS7WUU7_9BACT|nr:hypothetical protein [Campylobacter canadensis]MBZ7987799.1 hypothetical protein [Campylobacter canadensis]MBZ7995315.1 hypothetical protein [Campylobacter canadensis]MBZ7997015.1 hypothetical protein [Campylobacter canadensis]MBZ7999140.1 hypothetical protein [Campylobacter canadensis]MBZ8000667.1 hypothetical protein [Campylobacter canadensis]